MNPYNFVRMEWWRNKNWDGLGHAFVGFCSNGDVYLTFDVRRKEDGFYPVFSPLCKVGAREGHRKEAYSFYRDQFRTLRGYDIQSVDKCGYGDLHSIKKIYNFES